MTDSDCWACARDVAHDHDGADWSGCPHHPTSGEFAPCCADTLADRVEMLAASWRARRGGVPDVVPVDLDPLTAEIRAAQLQDDPLRVHLFGYADDESPPPAA